MQVESKIMKQWCIGVDVGGTFTKFVTLDGERRACETFQLPTPDNPQAIVEQMAAGASEAMSRCGLETGDVAGIGIGAPGPLDIENGVIIAMPNLPGMENVPLRDMVSRATGLPAAMENDANATALGEYLCGAGMDAKVMALLTLGTGIGSGIIIDGRIMHGAHGIAPELGHVIMVPGGELCGCGQNGCLERYCSAKYIARIATREVSDNGRASSLTSVLESKGEIDAKDINDARRAGDALAAEVWDRGAYYLALACVNICRLFDPEVIVFAGGLTKAGDDLMTPVRNHFAALRWKLTKPQVNLVVADLGNDAGAIGAAGVARAAFVD